MVRHALAVLLLALNWAVPATLPDSAPDEQDQRFGSQASRSTITAWGSASTSTATTATAAWTSTGTATDLPADPMSIPASQPLSALSALSTTARISLTLSGFTPAVLTTTVGDEVSWYNSSAQPQVLVSGWSYRIYLPLVLVGGGGAVGSYTAPYGVAPAADADGLFSATLPPGGVFTYTYTAAGIWPYHLAGSPQVNGRVVVQEYVPPDPADVAPTLDPSVATSLISATDFLYSGSDPIQTGVLPGTIELTRSAVLRGRVLNRDGSALPAVRVTILNHPEFGQTLSRADGMFDLAVNGGGLLTVNYGRDGYLPAQRQVQAPWQDYAWLPDVVLIPADRRVTSIDLTSPDLQVAQGSVISDSDGTRQATLLIPPGTTATLILSGGVTQAITQFHVRLTEYTVGSAGPQAMPGELPAPSGYTYAAEYTMDEAVAAGALNVRFSQPLIHYAQNFLGFAVGMPIPVGYYDRVLGQWVASSDGRVVKVVSITGGLANLDTTGSGAVDNGAALGVTDAERQRLGSLYPAGQTLWRIPVTHFSPWDFNWPYGPPPDATTPNQPLPRTGDSPLDSDCPTEGSLIGCESQTLGQAASLAGTPFRLMYSSARVNGDHNTYRLTIPLSGASVPASLLRIDLVIHVAGRGFSQSFPAAPDQSYAFTWDGKDGYGRTVQGRQPVNVTIGYVYPCHYWTPSERSGASFSAVFGQMPANGTPAAYCRSQLEVTLFQRWQGSLGGWQSRSVGLGGWDLDVHHTYDPGDRVLYLGDGTRHSANSRRMPIIRTAAGTGTRGYNGEGIPATQAQLDWPSGVAVGPDGSLYIADYYNYRVRRVGPDGIITTAAGNGTCKYNGDGMLATQAALCAPSGVAVGPDGSLYIADTNNNRIRRVGPDGIITTVAGTGTWGYSGDGMPATQAQLYKPYGVAVGPDGSLYIADTGNNRIRRVGPDEVISTVAGTGTAAYNGDGFSAAVAYIDNPQGVAVGPDGSLYIADTYNSRIRRVGPDGIISTVAGNAASGYWGDGIPATQASLYYPTSVAVGLDGSLYIADEVNNRIRLVGPDGVISTLAGKGTYGYNGDGIPATQAQLYWPAGVAVGPDGSLYIGDTWNNRVRRVVPLLAGFGVGDILIPAEDGGEVYHFDSTGRHLRTLDALTGAVRYQFSYDGDGRLIQVTDGDGNITTIEHDAAGNPTAIVGPYGQRTALQVDANGYLSSITDPAGGAIQLASSPDGLLQTFTDPRGGLYQYTYASDGRLVRDDDPAGGSKTLTRAETASGFRVTVTTALGRQTTYTVERLPAGGARRTTTDPSGATTVAVYGNDGTSQLTSPDGTLATLTTSPDPRWGMLAPIETSLVVTTPGGLVATRLITRTVILTDVNGPFSLAAMTETLSSGGGTAVSRYTAATRTITNTSPAGRRSVATLDAHGRVTRIERGGEDPVLYAYDSHGRFLARLQGSSGITYTYDVTGEVYTRADASGGQTHYGYDAAGRLIQTTLPSNNLYRFAYDANSNLTQVTPPNDLSHFFTYDPLDQPAGYTPPGGAPYAYTWVYDADRERTGVTLPGSLLEAYSYDAGGRVTALSYPSATVSYVYTDSTDLQTGITWNPTVGAAQSVSLTYDSANLAGLTWSGAATGRYTYTYGNDLQLSGVALDADPPVTLARDADGLVTRYGGFTYARGGPGGDPTLIGDGVLTATYAYNSLATLSARGVTVAGQSLYQEQMSYDSAGRLRQKVEALPGGTHTLSYTFDADGQLLAVWRDGSPVEQYGYDANGNRTGRQVGAGPAEAATYDGQDRLLQQGGVSYQFSAAGTLLQRGGDTFQYSARGELLRAVVGGQAATYAYDGLGRRVARTDVSGTTQYLYGNPGNPFQVTASRDPSGVRTAYTYDEGGRLLAFQRGAAWYYVATDFLGTPRLVAGADGVVVKRLEYDAFGDVLSDSNPGFDLPIGFAGGLTDNLTGLVHFGARDYDPLEGRWIARDPVLFEGRQVNLYAYVGNNPAQLADPWGLFSIGLNTYDGIGGGLRLTFTRQGFSWCGELGFGAGTSFELDPSSGLDKEGGSLKAETGVEIGPLISTKLKGQISLDGCQGKITPELCVVGSCWGEGRPKYKVDPSKMIDGDKLLKSFKVGVSSKATYKQCAAVNW